MAAQTASPPVIDTKLRYVDQFAENVSRTKAGQPITLCYNIFSGANAAVYRENLRSRGSAGYDTAAANARAHRHLTLTPNKYPTVLLLQTVAFPALFWDNSFCEALASDPSGPYDVVRFDFRDSGRSTFVRPGYTPRAGAAEGKGKEEEGEEEVEVYTKAYFLRYAYAAMRPGERVIAESYTVADLAGDAAALLRRLYAPFPGVAPRGHLIGMCLGGAMGQHLCITDPALVASLTCIDSHTSAPPPLTRWPSLRTALSFSSLAPWRLLSSPDVNVSLNAGGGAPLTPEMEKVVDAYVESFVLVAERLAGDTKKFPFDREGCRRQVRRVFARSGATLRGGPRQFLALLNAPRRDLLLRERVTSSDSGSSSAGGKKAFVPTLIIQGTADVLCPSANAEYLSECIEGSVVRLVDGMGHTLIPRLRADYVKWITENIGRARGPGGSSTSVATRAGGGDAKATEGAEEKKKKGVFKGLKTFLSSKL